MIALQCSIMRHLSVKQSSATSPPPPLDRVSELKTGATPDDLKPQDPPGSNSSPDPACPPRGTAEAPRGAACRCSAATCHNCRKPNGPLAEEPLKANGPVGSDSCREAELQHRLKPEAAAPSPAAASELVNHIGTEKIKTEPESVATEDCAQKNSTIWTHRLQQNHQEAGGEVAVVAVGAQDQSSNKLGSKSPTPGESRNPPSVWSPRSFVTSRLWCPHRREVRSWAGGPAAVPVSEGREVPGRRSAPPTPPPRPTR